MNIENLPKAIALQEQIDSINRHVNELKRALQSKNDHITVGGACVFVYLPYEVIDDLLNKALESDLADIKVLEQLIGKL